MKKRRKILKPIIYKESWHYDLYRKLMSVISEAIFKPLNDALQETDIKTNAKLSALEKALRNGTVQFQGGAFRGSIDSTISKEIKALGGKFVRGYWRLPSPSLPTSLQNAIYASSVSMKDLQQRVEKLTSDMPKTVSNMIADLSIESLGLQDVNRVSREFKQTVGREYAVMPDIGKEGQDILKEKYFDTTELPIKLEVGKKAFVDEFEERTKSYGENFAHEEIAKLRREISQLISDGRPRHEVKDLIKSRLKISSDRCKFIARQETSLLTSKLKEVQYKQAGINKYIWRTVGDNRVREGHEDLNGKEFSFDNPPDASHFNTGEPCNPGEDYNCFVKSTPITILGKPIKALKRRYAGNVINITTESKTVISATPNHPILTINGWRRFSDIKNGDKVFKFIGGDVFNGISMNIDDGHPAGKIFDLFNISFPFMRKFTTDIDFHGDGSDQEIQVISINGKLITKSNIMGIKKILNYFFSNSYSRTTGLIRNSSFSSLINWDISSLHSIMGSFDLLDSLDIGHLRPLKLFTLRLVSHFDSAFLENSSNWNARQSSILGYLINAFARFIFRNDCAGKDIYFIPDIGFFSVHDIIKSEVSYYEDYVYNFETSENMYLAHDFLVSNCRCVALPVIEW